MQRTKIEYLTHTWNPLAMRCTPVSEGCKNCWHIRMAHRMSANPNISTEERFAYGILPDNDRLFSGSPIMRTGDLDAPLKLRKQAVIGVQFMGDLFHESVTNEQIAAVFGVMAACPQHTFCVLTKRPERMNKWFWWWEYFEYGGSVIPLSNVWLGVSVEDQKTYEERWKWLCRTPAALRFISYEPALGELDLSRSFGLYQVADRRPDGTQWWATRAGSRWEASPDWVICGSETGPGKRPMNLDWARSLRDQCAAAVVPFFFKLDSDGNHELDGRIHEEMPEIGGK